MLENSSTIRLSTRPLLQPVCYNAARCCHPSRDVDGEVHTRVGWSQTQRQMVCQSGLQLSKRRVKGQRQPGSHSHTTADHVNALVQAKRAEPRDMFSMWFSLRARNHTDQRHQREAGFSEAVFLLDHRLIDGRDGLNPSVIYLPHINRP